MLESLSHALARGATPIAVVSGYATTADASHIVHPAPDGRLMLAVSDDGVGLPEGFDPQTAKGLGFRVMRGLAATIGAELQIESTCLGLCFRLLLPPTTAVVRSA